MKNSDEAPLKIFLRNHSWDLAIVVVLVTLFILFSFGVYDQKKQSCYDGFTVEKVESGPNGKVVYSLTYETYETTDADGLDWKKPDQLVLLDSSCRVRLIPVAMSVPASAPAQELKSGDPGLVP